MNANLALNKPAEPPFTNTHEQGSSISSTNTEIAQNGSEDPTLEKVKSSIRDVKVELLEDSICVYAIFELHGMELSLEIEGRILVQDGYLRLEPTRGKLGSLPLLAGTLRVLLLFGRVRIGSKSTQQQQRREREN